MSRWLLLIAYRRSTTDYEKVNADSGKLVKSHLLIYFVISLVFGLT
jgi:hypothetical protein